MILVEVFSNLNDLNDSTISAAHTTTGKLLETKQLESIRDVVQPS